MFNFILKQSHIAEAGFGNDLNETNSELEAHRREHKLIEQFQTQVEQCISAKVTLINDNLNCESCTNGHVYVIE